MTTLLIHLASTAIVLALFYPLVVLLLRAFRPQEAVTHRIAWGGVLLVPFFAMSLPVAVPVAAPVPAPVEVTHAPVVHENTAYHEQEENVLSHQDVATEQLALSRTDSALLPRPYVQEDKEIRAPQNEDLTLLRAQHPPEILPVEKTYFPAVDTIVQIATYLLLAVWLGGVTVVLRKRLRLHRKLVHYLNRHSPDESREYRRVQAVWQSLLRRHGISETKIPLLVTESLGPALVRRGLRHYLLMPQAACEEMSYEEGTDDVLEGIFRHELAHYRNADGFWLPFFRTLAALLWFHPLAKKALQNYETAVEWCCDEFAYLHGDMTNDQSGSALLAETFLTLHKSTLHESSQSLALNINTFARFNTLDRVDRLARSETLGKEPVMKKILLFTLLGLAFLCGTLHIRLVAQNDQDHPALSGTPPKEGNDSPPPEGGHFAQQNDGVVPSLPAKSQDVNVTAAEKDITIVGIVTLDGKPLPDVQIVFSPVKDQSVGTGTGVMSHKNGLFLFSPELTRDHLQPGEHRVWVFPHSDDPRRATFPKMYMEPGTTPLVIQVKEGRNVIDLEWRCRINIPIA